MSYTFKNIGVGIGSGGGATSPMSTSAITVSTGSLLVALYIIGNSSIEAPSSLGDNQNTSYTQVETAYNLSLYGGTNLGMQYLANAKAGSTQLTMHWTAGGYAELYLLEYANILTSNPLEVGNDATSQNSANPSLAVNANYNDNLIVFFAAGANAMSLTNTTQRRNDSGVFPIGDALATSSPFTATTTMSSGQWTAVIGSFKIQPAAAAAGPMFFLID